MPTTRRQQAIQEGRSSPPSPKAATTKPRARKGSKAQQKKAHELGDTKDDGNHPGLEEAHVGVKRQHGVVDQAAEPDSGGGSGVSGPELRGDVGAPPEKKVKVDEDAVGDVEGSKTGERKTKSDHIKELEEEPRKGDQDTQESKEDPITDPQSIYKTGVIERGHIYFFYRPKVEIEHVESIDDVRNFHMLLVPRPPDFAVTSANDNDDGVPSDLEKQDPSKEEETEMKVLQPGADAVPAPPVINKVEKQDYRVITIGKKRLPDPEKVGQRGGRAKEDFWATVTGVGDDLKALETKFQGKEYETKTRGTRHEGPMRLVARGAYAIVNTDSTVPSKRSTHLGYYISHPSPDDLGDVQKSLGIYTAASFHVQVKNPDAPGNAANVPQSSKGVEYPEWIMKRVFGSARYGAEEKARRQEYGLRFVCVETPELLDYEGAQLLLIASRHGTGGLDTSLGEDRGSALKAVEEKEADETIQKVFKELSFAAEQFPTEPLQGEWI